ncbi:MAG: N-acetyltransferase [Chitinophagaceae bacterium]|nr:MAG: N-acetyltransferase [Chitinophagaceae bacterium]
MGNFITPQLVLKRTLEADLPFLFEIQLDAEANYLAAFTSSDFSNKEAFLEKYSKFLPDPTKNTQTIFLDEVIIGSIAKFEIEGDAEITYWLDKKYWGKGLATKALEIFLSGEKTRPILGRVAFDNFASQRLLEKNGFTKIGSDKGFANARQQEIEEFIYRLT